MTEQQIIEYMAQKGLSVEVNFTKNQVEIYIVDHYSDYFINPKSIDLMKRQLDEVVNHFKSK